MSTKIYIGTAWSILQILAWTFIIAWLVMLPLNYFNMSLDNSDRDGFHRSGLSISIDHATGVNYFTTITGGICVRITTNGTPYITKP